jgi:hypothetical protein
MSSINYKFPNQSVDEDAPTASNTKKRQAGGLAASEKNPS